MKKILSAGLCLSVLATALCGCGTKADTEALSTQMQALYGENQVITGDYDENLAAECTNGTFVGTEENGVISYKGIPYAQSPTGDLRWKAPVSAEDSDTVYEAYYYGSTSVQSEWASEISSYYPQGEDCLNLNVWTNSAVGEGKSVVVFFHGGSYGWGGTSDPLYDCQNLAEKFEDIVYVTVDYRTGMMGFIDLSSVEGGEEYAESGNLGLLDMIEALRWIQKNIEAFGGDPGNVTIMGESAGAGAVSLLPLIDGTDGLFQKIIAESGSIALTYSTEECQDLTSVLLEKSGAQNMDDLLALSEEELMELAEELGDYNNFPERDGVVLPTDLYEAYASGAASDVTMLIGTNADEARYWIQEMGYYTSLVSGLTIYSIGMPMMYETNLKNVSDEDMEAVDAFMDSQTEKKLWKLTEFYNELCFRLPAIYQAETISESGGTVYMYYWEYPSAIENLGACHAVELAYVFNNLDETIYTGDNIDAALAANVQEMWANFIRTGNPSTVKYEWDSYDTETRSTMVLGEEIHIEQDPLGTQRETLWSLLKYGFNGCYTNLSYNVPTIWKLVAIVILAVAIIVAMPITIIRVRKRKRK